VRHGNEDAFLADDGLGLFVVADGMGGHNAGEVASQLALDTVTGFIRRTADDREFSWPYGVLLTLSYDANRLRTAIHLANRRIFRTSESQDEYLGMGTTVVAALVADHQAAIAHVGDSRAYLFRRGVLKALTTDDSWVATLLAADTTADPKSFSNHPMRSVLTNVLGAREDTDVHVAEHALLPGDVLLLSSDGVHGVLEPEAISAVLGRTSTPETMVGDLITAALANGSRDNLTALVVAVSSEEPEP
jgi:protein phosphatase